MGCDSSHYDGGPAGVYLSVSSNGSNGLRLNFATGEVEWWASFSILERIEWAATHRAALAVRLVQPFSILERIEWAATPRHEAEMIYRVSFSILERIEWAATAASTS